MGDSIPNINRGNQSGESPRIDKSTVPPHPAIQRAMANYKNDKWVEASTKLNSAITHIKNSETTYEIKQSAAKSVFESDLSKVYEGLKTDRNKLEGEIADIKSDVEVEEMTALLKKIVQSKLFSEEEIENRFESILSHFPEVGLEAMTHLETEFQVNEMYARNKAIVISDRPKQEDIAELLQDIVELSKNVDENSYAGKKLSALKEDVDALSENVAGSVVKHQNPEKFPDPQPIPTPTTAFRPENHKATLADISNDVESVASETLSGKKQHPLRPAAAISLIQKLKMRFFPTPEQQAEKLLQESYNISPRDTQKYLQHMNNMQKFIDQSISNPKLNDQVVDLKLRLELMTENQKYLSTKIPNSKTETSEESSRVDSNWLGESLAAYNEAEQLIADAMNLHVKSEQLIRSESNIDDLNNLRKEILEFIKEMNDLQSNPEIKKHMETLFNDDVQLRTRILQQQNELRTPQTESLTQSDGEIANRVDEFLSEPATVQDVSPVISMVEDRLLVDAEQFHEQTELLLQTEINYIKLNRLLAAVDGFVAAIEKLDTPSINYYKEILINDREKLLNKIDTMPYPEARQLHEMAGQLLQSEADNVEIEQLIDEILDYEKGIENVDTPPINRIKEQLLNDRTSLYNSLPPKISATELSFSDQYFSIKDRIQYSAGNGTLHDNIELIEEGAQSLAKQIKDSGITISPKFQLEMKYLLEEIDQIKKQEGPNSSGA